jgi:LacI family transcriptional regulator
MNILEIAKKAGVSRSTVSRVLTGEGYVSETTRQRVMEIIEAENFTPNAAARALVTKRTQIIGIVIPDPIKNILATENSHYYSTLLQGITEEAHLRDYATLLWVGHASEAETSYYKRILKNRSMDGLLIVASVSSEAMLLNHLLKNKTHFVQIGRPMYTPEAISYVAVDNVKAAEQAVKHLLGMGRRRIGTITGTLENADSQDRLRGYERALASMGITPDPTLIIKGGFSRDWGYAGMKELLRYRVDAVFAASDLIAIGALAALEEQGLRVPDDVAIVGFDDLPFATYAKPALTTIRQPIAEKAAQAASLLLDLIEGRVEGPVQLVLPTQLIIRESCGYVLQERKRNRAD